MSRDRIFVSDLRSIKYCLPGSRKWFRRNNLDWRSFLKNGIPVKELLKINDVMVKKLMEHINGK